MSKTVKEFFLLYGPLAIATVLIATWFLHSRNQSYQEIVGERQATVVGQSSRIVGRDMRLLASDAQFMARLVARHFRRAESVNFRDLDDIFTDFARSRGFYFILRYIDESGVERVRVDRSFAGPVVSPEGSLQYKGDRYYFKESMRAGKNDVYISNFDLNIEHGRVEIPYRPTLRFGCPVIDVLGNKRGVVVLNYNGVSLLKEIRKQDVADIGISMLSNGEGFWMLGPRAEDEWGHVLDGAKNSSMGKRFPKAWEFILRFPPKFGPLVKVESASLNR